MAALPKRVPDMRESLAWTLHLALRDGMDEVITGGCIPDTRDTAANVLYQTSVGYRPEALFEEAVKTVEFDAVYFFRVGNEGFIKRLQRVPGKGLLAISENPAYRDWVIDETMDLEVFGRVLKVWRSEDF